ncbi:hypothetical protein V3331_14820 [Gaopeijia maritima]|uniref:hypothetical protein n=1 Tax=Gaopeijia maritima TaxID=3119007 RepID=UPI00324AC5A1
MHLRTLLVRRYPIGSVPTLLLLLGAIAACDSGPAQPDDGDDDEEPSSVLIRVQGSSMGSHQQNIRLFEGNLELTGATVTVNGMALSESDPGYYRGVLPQVLSAGEQLRLRVESQGRVVEGVAAIPPTPELTTPVSGDFFDRSSDLQVGWASPGDPDIFRVGLSWTVGTVSSGTYVEAAGSARETSVSSADVPEPVDAVRAAVEALVRGTFTGAADPASDMNVRVVGQSADLTLERPLVVRGLDMSPQYQNVQVYDDGGPVTGAAVTVNGVALGEASDGYYTGQLPTALGTGEELLLRVEAGGRVVEGVATITAVPMLTAPVEGQPFDPLADLSYEWTAAQDPDLFEMRLDWVKDGVGSGTSVSAQGSARSGVVSPAAVPIDPASVEASVFGYLRGEFTGPAHPDSDMRVRIAGAPTALAVEPLLHIVGGSMSTSHQHLNVYRGDEPVTGATVTVNGVPLGEIVPGRYSGQLPAALAPGEEIRLRVEAGPQVVQGVATIVEPPVLTSPVDGQALDLSSDLQFSWTATQNPDYFQINLFWTENGSGHGRNDELSGSDRVGSISTTGLPHDLTSPRAALYSYLRGTFSGPAHPDSDMRVRISGGTADLTLPPPPR